MSLRMLQKQTGGTSQSSAAAKAVTQPAGRRGGGGYYSSADQGSQGSGGGYYSAEREKKQDSGSGGFYASRGMSSGSHGNGGGEGYGGGGGGGATICESPAVVGGFRGSDAQRRHVEMMRKSTAEAPPVAPPTQDIAVKSHLGLDALRERKRKEEEEKQAKREAARAKRRQEANQQEVEEEHALAECEAQAWNDSETMERVKYEAALIVRIACRFGTSGVWTKLAEARARGADIPLDPRRIYVLAHPDKCPMPEASDATAILNAQRPPEMTEARPHRPRPAAEPGATAAASTSSSTATDSAPAAEVSTQEAESTAQADAEKRVDPDDQQELTFDELKRKYKDQYSAEEIEVYWQADCKMLQPKVLASTASSTQRKTRKF
eukprot:TRINITY_DN6079_c0_g1_i1.p1 TRINITY_DN6079_c0_g1~~TRINITY_DN6079_c0_g1_i1.p1  ORF type:complete len:403 (+),score=124.53 TRINITY_DN6079_c0_g1_i1:74-1210(+)